MTTARQQPLRLLLPLREVDGVYGSFWVSGSGRIIARDLSSVIADASIARAGQELARLWRLLAHIEPEELSLRFGAHQLLLTRLGSSTLCLFAAPRASQAALRAASRSLRPRLEAHLRELHAARGA